MSRAVPHVTTRTAADGAFSVKCARCGAEEEIGQSGIRLDDLVTIWKAFEEKHRGCA